MTITGTLILFTLLAGVLLLAAYGLAVGALMSDIGAVGRAVTFTVAGLLVGVAVLLVLTGAGVFW